MQYGPDPSSIYPNENIKAYAKPIKI